MKFNILNSLMVGTIFITTLQSLEARDQQNNLDVNSLNGDYQANAAQKHHEVLKNNCSTPVRVIRLINLWQENAIYLKSGIESLARSETGFDIIKLLEILDRKTEKIKNTIEKMTGETNLKPFNEFGRALNRQNRLFLDYTVAYRDGNELLQQELFYQIEQANRQISHSLVLILELTCKHRARLQELLQQRIKIIIEEIQDFVNAANNVPPPGQIADFGAAYMTYNLSLDVSQEVGRTIGNAALK